MDTKAVSSAVAKFAAKFCNELKKDTSVVASPLSAEFLLALITLGAKDPSHAELLTALGIPNDDAIRSAFSNVSEKLRTLKGVTFNVANQIYVKEGHYELNAALKEDAVKVFDAGIQKLDFVNSHAAAKTINDWVESKTNNKIKDLLSADSLNEDTRMVLVNALYFKGTWKTQFNSHHTRDQPFHVNANTTIQVPMMYKEADYKYTHSDALGAQILEMPYVGEEASMVIVLPSEIEGLGDVMKKLADGYDLIGDLEKMFTMKIQVSVPKFKIETEINLNELLPKVGIKSIFEGNSGLDNLISPPEPLCVSKAVQKAFIEVNEEGAEAAAATGMVMMLRCARPPTPRFTCERPFLYLLFGPDHSTLFAGVYRGPASY